MLTSCGTLPMGGPEVVHSYIAIRYRPAGQMAPPHCRGALEIAELWLVSVTVAQMAGFSPVNPAVQAVDAVSEAILLLEMATTGAPAVTLPW